MQILYTFGHELSFSFLAILALIAKFSVRQHLVNITCIMSITHAIYTQYHSVCQTKCLPIYITFQFIKLYEKISNTQ